MFGHGLLGSLEQVEEYGGEALARLTARARLLTFDARGHGQSEGLDDPAAYTWESLGLDMEALSLHAGERQAIVGGGSMGAAAALWLAIERPHSVRGLVLVMPPPLGPPELRGDEERQALAVLELLSTAVQSVGIEQTVELARQFPGFAATTEEAEARAQWLRAQNPRALRYAIPGLLRSPFHDPAAYRGIRVPTLVMAHEGDGLHPARAARLLAESIPGCRATIAPDPSYWRTHPDEFAREVESFLDAVG